MDMQDRRVKRTQQALAHAVIALTLEKGYEAITIRDITEWANVGYATFFRHYKDKDSLLQDVLDVVLTELTDLLPTSADADPELVGTLLFRYVQGHNVVVRVLLSSRSSATFLQHIVDVSTARLLDQYTAKEGSDIPVEIAINHMLTSSIALIQWWLDHDMPYPPEKMGLIYKQMIMCPMYSTLQLTESI